MSTSVLSAEMGVPDSQLFFRRNRIERVVSCLTGGTPPEEGMRGTVTILEVFAKIEVTIWKILRSGDKGRGVMCGLVFSQV